MIYSKKELRESIKSDLTYYLSKKSTKKKKLYSWFMKDNAYLVKQFIIQLRKCEYFLNNSYRTTGNISKMGNELRYIFAKKKLNRLQIVLGLEIYENCFGPGLTIYHTGGTVVHPKSKVGKNFKLHGNNCIGNKGKEGDLCPVIGNNVQLGVGAKVIGDIKIADDIVIAAGSVVVDSFLEPGSILAGVPARKIR